MVSEVYCGVSVFHVIDDPAFDVVGCGGVKDKFYEDVVVDGVESCCEVDCDCDGALCWFPLVETL